MGKIDADLKKAAGQLQDKREDRASRERIEGGKLAVKVAEGRQKAEAGDRKQSSSEEATGFKIGLDVAKQVTGKTGNGGKQ